MRSLLLESVRLSSRREVAIVLFLCDCSQHIPSRGTAHRTGGWLCLVVADANLSVANSSPYSHSIQSNVRPAETVVCFSVAASRVAPRVGSYGRDLKRRVSRSDRTTVPSFGWFLCVSLTSVFLIWVGFVVLSSVGAHFRAKRMAPADDRT